MNTPEPAIADCDEPGSTNEPDVPPEPTVTLHCSTRCAGDLNWLHRQIELVIPLLSRPVEHVEVLIVDDESMIDFHQRFCDDDTTTDVLTFPSTTDMGTPLDVHIIINVEEALRQSKSRPHGALKELLLYVVHGLLHCCGHDDKAPEDSDRMHAEEDRLLEAIGVGRVYDHGGES